MADAGFMLPSRSPILAPLLFLGALSSLGCAASSGEVRIASPGDDDAKATLDVRVDHASRPSEHSADKIVVGDNELTPGKHAVFPQPTKVRIATEFWHDVTVVEVHKVSVAHERWSYNADGSSHVSYYYTDELRDVTVTRKIPDGACTSERSFRFARDRRYRITSTFLEAGRCELTCIDDSFRPCEIVSATESLPPPIKERKVEHPLHVVGIATAAVGVAGLLASAGLAIAAGSHKPAIREHCDAAKTCDAVGLAEVAQAHDLGVKATLVAVPAGAALIGGVVLLTLPSKWMRIEVGRNGPASAAVRGSF